MGEQRSPDGLQGSVDGERLGAVLGVGNGDALADAGRVDQLEAAPVRQRHIRVNRVSRCATDRAHYRPLLSRLRANGHAINTQH
jgi:hypothetical protein